MFILPRDTELTTGRIAQMVQRFDAEKRPRLQRWLDYYTGKQDILRKTVKDKSKPCNRIVTNYCANIVSNYQGYLTGIPVTYKSEDDLEGIQQVLSYNDVQTADSQLLQAALVYGVAYEVNYLDRDKQQRFKTLDSRECFPVYDDTLDEELLYFIRYTAVDRLCGEPTAYQVEVYDREAITRYTCGPGFAGMLQQGEPQPHYYSQVPVSVFPLNEEQVSIFDQIMTLQDAYNTLLSGEVDDFQAFCDAYLVIKGMTAGEEELAQMKENRVLLLDEGSSAEYLYKTISDTQVENMLQNINDNIHKMANSPDFNDEKFMSTTGIAMRYKLTGFENTASGICAGMKKALQKRIELICAVLSLSSGDKVWRDIDIAFTRNLPVNTLEVAQLVNLLRGLVSSKTLLAQLPFVEDPQAELEQLEGEQAQEYDLRPAGALDE